MADLEVTSLVLDYKWKGTIQRPDTIKDPKTILSDYINFFGEDTFQASFKMIKDSIYDLRFNAVNLNKMGFSVDQVLVSSWPLPKHRRMTNDDIINVDSKLGFSLPGAIPFSRQLPAERPSHFQDLHNSNCKRLSYPSSGQLYDGSSLVIGHQSNLDGL